MPRKATPAEVTLKAKQLLQKIANAQTSSKSLSIRANVVLMSASRHSDQEIADKLEVTSLKCSRAERLSESTTARR